MHGVEDPEYYDLDPPTLFSPHIYVPERGEKVCLLFHTSILVCPPLLYFSLPLTNWALKLTFGPKGYMMRLSRFMV